MSMPSGPGSALRGYRAGSQATKVVLLTVFAAVAAAGAVWWGADIAQTWGLRPADGGVLKPLWQRILFGGSLAVLGLAFLVGMIVYWRFYIVRIDSSADGRTVTIGRLPPFAEVTRPSDHVRVGDRVHTGEIELLGVMSAQARGVHARWRLVSVRGWRWPLILDMRGQFPPPRRPVSRR
jgi:hypothetical protein